MSKDKEKETLYQFVSVNGETRVPEILDLGNLNSQDGSWKSRDYI